MSGTRLVGYGSVAVALVFAIILYGAYSWRKGFETGADTVLCLGFQQQFGASEGMKERPCQNIKGKSLPPFQQWFADVPAYQPQQEPRQ